MSNAYDYLTNVAKLLREHNVRARASLVPQNTCMISFDDMPISSPVMLQIAKNGFLEATNLTPECGITGDHRIRITPGYRKELSPLRCEGSPIIHTLTHCLVEMTYMVNTSPDGEAVPQTHQMTCPPVMGRIIEHVEDFIEHVARFEGFAVPNQLMTSSATC